MSDIDRIQSIIDALAEVPAAAAMANAVQWMDALQNEDRDAELDELREKTAELTKCLNASAEMRGKLMNELRSLHAAMKGLLRVKPGSKPYERTYKQVSALISAQEELLDRGDVS
jgi:hypothetical protein